MPDDYSSSNHHSFATSAKLSNRWYEFDIGWMYIRILCALGLARVKKLAPVPKIVAPRSEVDFATLQAVIDNRYDVLARYAGSLKNLYREEMAKFQDKASYKGVKRWLEVEINQIPDDWRKRLDELLARSHSLATLYAMRAELSAVWNRTNATREQLVIDLQTWCHKAEASGIRQLQELSIRMRSYAVA